MVRSARSWRFDYVAALLAVMLLSLAGVRSTVMQAAMAAPPAAAAPAAMPACGMSRGMTDGRGHPADAAHRTCAFCAVAGHLPVCARLPSLPTPTVAAWLTWRPVGARGARGPPAFAPRARGPPAAPLTA